MTPPSAADPVWHLRAADAEATRALGAALAQVVRGGDLVILTGGLGAGKTTLTQGLGRGLGVRGRISSPTFTIAREHRAQGGGPDLVHVDAYRLGSMAELDALDLDSSLEDSVTVVEWGQGHAEALAENRLLITIHRPRGADDAADVGTLDLSELAEEAPRDVTIEGVGPRWRAAEARRAMARALGEGGRLS